MEPRRREAARAAARWWPAAGLLALATLGGPGCRDVMTSTGRARTNQRAWVELPSGYVRPGAPRTESCRRKYELTPTDVTIDHGLQVSTFEVTQAQFEAAMGYEPSFNGGCPSCPVESVSWHEAAAYCVSLDARLDAPRACYTCTGAGPSVACTPTPGCTGYRLPTEAEWEYLARAGTRTPTYAGRITSCMSSDEVADRIGWYKANSVGETHPVGEMAANPWGLHDVSGNVYEWTDEPGEPGERILKGGSWYHNAHHLRAGSRLPAPAEEHLSYAGFRCVRTLASNPAR